ncbi:MAG: hypothetical protein PHI23_03810, partial [Candidatus Peribacteraceae bacterium]|nr:hypothetical protein [Candidatus Peribacteraceae bacterium]
MSTITSVGGTAETSSPTMVADRHISDGLSRPLAERIIADALRSPESLEQVHPFLRAHRQWFRGVVIELLNRIPPLPEGFTGDPWKDVLAHVPEFFGDAEVRRAAHLFPTSDSVGLACQERMGRFRPNYPREEPLEGAPLTQERPAKYVSGPLTNGRARKGECDICEAQAVLLVHEMVMHVREEAIMQLRSCDDCTR